MVTRAQLQTFLAELLKPELFKDYCPNGLQVQGNAKVERIATAVTASQLVINQAIAYKADALLVHHGYFWPGEPAPIVGIKYQRIAALIKHDINLFAYHLPLDAHQIIGNNVQLAKLLNLTIKGTLDGNSQKPGLVFYGSLAQPLTAADFAKQIAVALQREPLHIAGSKPSLKTIAWCTGGAQDYLQLAVDNEIDAFITGEASERTYHLAKEADVHFFGAGHHATERFGIQALGELLADKFALQHVFLDEDNPV